MDVITNMPLVTVIIATYNRIKLLDIAIRSVVNQTYKNIEIVVVNDGGINVINIINKYKEHNIIYVNLNINMGAAHAYNQGILNSTGSLITYLNDDDIYYSNHCEVLVSEIIKKNIYVAYSNQYKVECEIKDGLYTNIKSKKVEFSVEFDKLHLLILGNFIPLPCIMHRRDILVKTGLFDENQKVLIDYDLCRRMAFYTDFYHVNIITGEYFFPTNKKERITDLHTLNPKLYNENRINALSKVPKEPWHKIKYLHFVIYCKDINESTFEIIKNIELNYQLPKKIYILINNIDSNIAHLKHTLDENFLNVMLYSNYQNYDLTVNTFLRSNILSGWVFILKPNIDLTKEHWFKIFLKVDKILKSKDEKLINNTNNITVLNNLEI